MIYDLDCTLEKLLRSDLPASFFNDSPQLTITFVEPGQDFPPPAVTLPALDLFLYDVRENRELRSNEVEFSYDSNGVMTYSAPLVRIDCSYLITAWPSKNIPSPAREEHILLGETMEVLLRHPLLPASILQRRLADADLPLPTTALQTTRLQSMGEFWQALGGKAKAALHYTVTIAVAPTPPVEAGPPVTEKDLRFRLGVEAQS